MDNAYKTIAYTDQHGRIKLFKVTAREFASSSIWKNPLLPKVATTFCPEQKIGSLVPTY
jgi:hypothetical protein